MDADLFYFNLTGLKAMCRLLGRVVLTGILCAGVRSNMVAQVQQTEPTAMPADRVKDSFLIYSALIPLGETAGPGWPHDFWLVEDSTVEPVPHGNPCEPMQDGATHHKDSSTNPYFAIRFPDLYLLDGREILADFDAHCHERWKLDIGTWTTKGPVRLLSRKEQAEFSSTRFGPPPPKEISEKYKGAGSLYSFSGVYFNHTHTVAIVYATHWCGGLCGEGFWVAFTNDGMRWIKQNWTVMRWIS